MERMKRLAGFILALALVLGLTACGAKARWQEQYDLGVRYLSEGNYEEAVLAFTAAIEIDSRDALAYLGRGNASFWSDTEGAEADFRKAVELDSTLTEAYLGLAELYVWRNDYEAVVEMLRQGLAAASGAGLVERKTADNRGYVIYTSIHLEKRETTWSWAADGFTYQKETHQYDESMSLVRCSIDPQYIDESDYVREGSLCERDFAPDGRCTKEFAICKSGDFFRTYSYAEDSLEVLVSYSQNYFDDYEDVEIILDLQAFPYELAAAENRVCILLEDWGKDWYALEISEMTPGNDYENRPRRVEAVERGMLLILDWDSNVLHQESVPPREADAALRRFVGEMRPG